MHVSINVPCTALDNLIMRAWSCATCVPLPLSRTSPADFHCKLLRTDEGTDRRMAYTGECGTWQELVQRSHATVIPRRRMTCSLFVFVYDYDT